MGMKNKNSQHPLFGKVFTVGNKVTRGTIVVLQPIVPFLQLSFHIQVNTRFIGIVNFTRLSLATPVRLATHANKWFGSTELQLNVGHNVGDVGSRPTSSPRWIGLYVKLRCPYSTLVSVLSIRNLIGCSNNRNFKWRHSFFKISHQNRPKTM